MKKYEGTAYLWGAFFMILLVLTLTACTPSPDFELYEGNSLRIAVVGEPPEVKEEQVQFTEISLDTMKNKELNSYDAVMIMEDNLIEAADSQYADIYVDSAIPFFFIGTYLYAPFTEKDLEYDQAMNWSPGIGYAVGILFMEEEDSIQKWEYGLYNDEKNAEHVKDVYSRIFRTIDEQDL